MPLLNRLRRLAGANITHWLNQVETPEAEVEAKIRELEAGAVEAKNALASFAVTYKRLEKNIQDLKTQEQSFLSKVEAALVAGDDAAARKLLAGKLKISERLERLEPVLDSRRETYDELKEALVEIHDQLNQARARLMDLHARKRAAEAEKTLGRSLESSRVEGAVPFERLEDAVLQSECESEVEKDLRQELGGLSMDKEEVDRKIESELSALKLQLQEHSA
jgi:phage shock protein A